MTFDAYGEVLGEQSQVTDVDRLDEALNRLSLSELPATSDQGCVGGPSMTLEVSDASDTVVRRIHVVPCDGDEDTEAELRSIIEPVLAVFNLDRP